MAYLFVIFIMYIYINYIVNVCAHLLESILKHAQVHETSSAMFVVLSAVPPLPVSATVCPPPQATWVTGSLRLFTS